MSAKLGLVLHRPEGAFLVVPYWNHFRAKEHCRDCPDGAGLSVTVFFPGLGDSVVDGRFEYVLETQMVLASYQRHLGERIDPTATRHDGVPAPLTPPCCAQVLLAVELDPRRTVHENAEDVSLELRGIVERAVKPPTSWIREVCFHLIGFSAGGLVAIDTARETSERLLVLYGGCAVPRPPGQTWCDRAAPSEVRVGIDVVTIATPYDGAPFVPEVLAELGLLFSFRDSPTRFRDSVGAEDYGGGPKPACLRASSPSSPRRASTAPLVGSLRAIVSPAGARRSSTCRAPCTCSRRCA